MITEEMPAESGGFVNALEGIRAGFREDVLTSAKAAVDVVRDEYGPRVKNTEEDLAKLRADLDQFNARLDEAIAETERELAETEAAVKKLKDDVAAFIVGLPDLADEQRRLAKVLERIGESAGALTKAAGKIVNPTVNVVVPKRTTTKSILYGPGGFPSQIIEEEQQSTGGNDNGIA